MKPYPDVSTTLTRTELAAPFQIEDVVLEPLPDPTRTALEWQDYSYTERDPKSGKILSLGRVELP